MTFRSVLQCQTGYNIGNTTTKVLGKLLIFSGQLFCLEFETANCHSGAERLCRCVRCPTAYHPSYTCIAAGCQMLSADAMICSRHVISSKVHSHLSTTWCLTCDKGNVYCSVRILTIIYCYIIASESVNVLIQSLIDQYAQRVVIPLPSARQHPSYGDCLEIKTEYYQNALCWIV